LVLVMFISVLFIGLWMHGIVHLLGADPEMVTSRGVNEVINVFGHRILEV
jgi:hypothetical protein